MFPRSLIPLFLVLSTALQAQVRPDSTRRDTTRTLEGIAVRGVAPATTVAGASVVRARLDSVALPASPSMEQLLRALPLLHVRRNSRGEAEISVRGSDSRQVAVLVDGIPISLAWDARADVSVIPATAVQSVSFARGLPSMLYGPNVLGGVVELGVGQSFVVPEHATAELAAESDHLGGIGTRATLSVPHTAPSGATWVVRSGIGFSDIGNQPLARGVTEPLPGARGRRLNTDARTIDGFASLRHVTAGGAWFSGSASAFRGERGIAAELGGGGGERYWRYPVVARSVMVLSGGTGDRRTPLGRGDLEASVGLDLGRTDIDSYTDRTYTTRDEFEDGRDRTMTLRLLADHTLGRRGDLRTAVTVSDIRHDESLPAGAARYRQQLFSLGAETLWRLSGARGAMDWARLSLGGAWDHGQTPEAGGRPLQPDMTRLGARVGATASFGAGRTLLHAGVSRRGRFPALRELYSGSLNRFAPNPDLVPERLVAVEAGLTTRRGRSEFQAVGFRHQLADAVVRITLPDGRFQRVNRNRLTSSGLELLATTVVGTAVIGGELTLQAVKLTDGPAGVSNRPEHLPARFGAVHAALPLPFGAHGWTRVRFTGSQSCIDPGTGQDATLGAGAITTLGISRMWSLRATGLLRVAEVRASVDNLADTALYDQCGLPQPGRLLRLQLRFF